MTDDALDGLVAELRDEAIKDGDPETCLGWAAADAIDALRRELRSRPDCVVCAGEVGVADRAGLCREHADEMLAKVGEIRTCPTCGMRYRRVS